MTLPVTKFEVPVLLIVFNRPQETQEVFKVIKILKPAYLYIAADGPRRSRPQEIELCQQTRDIFKEIDWDCNVETFFREENVGCKLGVSGALKWFFNAVESGIVLEDDCVPDLTFFMYCQLLLEKYKLDQRIGMITGRNDNFNFANLDKDYDFSTSGSIWGWASWKRVMKDYDEDNSFILKDFKNNIFEVTVDAFEQTRLYHQLKWTYSGKIDTWDYQLHAMLKLNSMLYLVPRTNLIKNIGFSGTATHTRRKDPRSKVESSALSFPLKVPQYIKPNRALSKAMVRADSNNRLIFLYLILLFKFRDFLTTIRNKDRK